MDSSNQPHEKGQIPIKEFCSLFLRPQRGTDYLEVGDYVVTPLEDREDVLALERVDELNSPREGDFLTASGTTVIIDRSIFVKPQRNSHVKYTLIEGARVRGQKNRVYAIAKRYFSRMEQSHRR